MNELKSIQLADGVRDEVATRLASDRTPKRYALMLETVVKPFIPEVFNKEAPPKVVSVSDVLATLSAVIIAHLAEKLVRDSCRRLRITTASRRLRALSLGA